MRPRSGPVGAISAYSEGAPLGARGVSCASAHVQTGPFQAVAACVQWQLRQPGGHSCPSVSQSSSGWATKPASTATSSAACSAPETSAESTSTKTCSRQAATRRKEADAVARGCVAVGRGMYRPDAKARSLGRRCQRAHLWAWLGAAESGKPTRPSRFVRCTTVLRVRSLTDARRFPYCKALLFLCCCKDVVRMTYDLYIVR